MDDGGALLSFRCKDRRPRDALLSWQILLRHSLRRNRRGCVDRSAWLLRLIPQFATESCACHYGCRSLSPYVSTTHLRRAEGAGRDCSRRSRDYTSHRAALDGLLAE